MPQSGTLLQGREDPSTERCSGIRLLGFPGSYEGFDASRCSTLVMDCVVGPAFILCSTPYALLDSPLYPAFGSFIGGLGRAGFVMIVVEGWMQGSRKQGDNDVGV